MSYSPEQYREVAHLLARGRDHRFREDTVVSEEVHPSGSSVGAWVTLDVWVSAQDVARMLVEREHGDVPLERPESDR